MNLISIERMEKLITEARPPIQRTVVKRAFEKNKTSTRYAY